MASTKLMQEIENVLQQFEGKYFVGDKVNKARVIEDIDNYDVDLMSAMLDNEKIKNNFTTKIEEHIVFKTNQFLEVFQADEYWEDSYTKYSKKIGLTSNGNFLDEASETVLDFPYKDTVLKASMSKEDTDKEDLKPDEPFLNEIIAREEIDVLLDKKILKNAKRYTADGEEDISDFSEKDNLILKGNNLLALHTLKAKYAGKVKLIYLDPPYNTGQADTFAYNDSFNLSTWLTFLKNRLEIAKELLSDDGLIAVSMSQKYQPYLRIILDNIFGMKNFITDFVWEKKKKPAFLSKVGNITETISIYSKSHDEISELTYGVTEEGKKYPFNNAGNGLTELTFPKHSVIFSMENQKISAQDMSSGNIITKLLNDLVIENGTNKNSFTLKGEWRYSQDSLDNMIENNETITISQSPFRPNRIMKGLKPKKVHNLLDRAHYSMSTYEDSEAELNKLGLAANFNYAKPEKLINFLIETTTSENDIVLDFFMGSSTTQAVAHKMNRQYIGIEQMDYINTVSVPRLQKVIEGEQGGISEDVNWQGGDSFVYAELMEKNRGYLTDVMDAPNQDLLRQTFNLMLENADFDFRVDLEEVEDSLNTLALEDQKRVLVKILDKNQLYYNYSEIDDENVRDLISDNDYEFNKSFYKEDNDE